MARVASMTLTVEEMDEIHEGGQTTWLSDWVIDLDLSAEAIRLYAWMCRKAKDDEESNGSSLTLTKREASAYAKGDGAVAVAELIKAGAITKIASYGSRGTRFYLETYSPRVRALRSRRTQAGGLPVVTYG